MVRVWSIDLPVKEGTLLLTHALTSLSLKDTARNFQGKESSHGCRVQSYEVPRAIRPLETAIRIVVSKAKEAGNRKLVSNGSEHFCKQAAVTIPQAGGDGGGSHWPWA